MRHYEVMIVLAPDQAEDGFNKHLERFKKIIEDGGGNVVNDDRWGIRSLAYPIKKYDQGFYTVIEWESTPDLLSELDHTLRLEENVLRHMVIHLDSTALAALAEMRAKRTERPSEDYVDPPDDAVDDKDIDLPDIEEPELEQASETEPEPESEPEAEPGPEAETDQEPEAEPEAVPEVLESSESEASDETGPDESGDVDTEEAEEEK
ncbi:30S ribosomal protein S6 [Gemmatimonadota bacterium]